MGAANCPAPVRLVVKQPFSQAFVRPAESNRFQSLHHRSQMAVQGHDNIVFPSRMLCKDLMVGLHRNHKKAGCVLHFRQGRKILFFDLTGNRQKAGVSGNGSEQIHFPAIFRYRVHTQLTTQYQRNKTALCLSMKLTR